MQAGHDGNIRNPYHFSGFADSLVLGSVGDNHVAILQNQVIVIGWFGSGDERNNVFTAVRDSTVLDEDVAVVDALYLAIIVVQLCPR